jgi:hypothetical protein
LQVLNVEHGAVVGLLRNGSTVFSALSNNQAALRNLITTSESVFSETAANQRALTQTVHVFPTFLTESRKTLAQLKTFALNTDPLLKQLVPVAKQLPPTLASVKTLSPSLRHLFTNLNPLITVSKTGLPALSKTLNGATPLLGALGPFLEQLNPILTWLSSHQQLTSDFLSQLPAAISAKTSVFGGDLNCSGTPCGHYLRQFTPSGPEVSSFNQTRDANSRGNTYPEPLWLGDPRDFSAGGKFPGSFALPAWDCPNGEQATSGSNQACWEEPPLGPLIGQASKFPRLGPATYSNK